MAHNIYPDSETGIIAELLDRSDGHAIDVAGGGVAFKRDRFALSSAGSQDLDLTHIPEPDSEHVYLNGIEQDGLIDYSLSGSTLSLRTAMDTLAGDIVDVRYAYRDSAVAGTTVTAPEFWYQAGSLNLANGATVSHWPDSSTNGNDATATGSGTTYLLSAVNGLPALRWSSVNPFTTGATGRTAGSWSAFAVFRASSDMWTGSKIVSSFFGGVTHSRQFRIGMGADPTECHLQALEQNVNNYGLDDIYTIAVDDSWHIAGVVVDVTAGTGHYWLDGLRAAALSPGSSIVGTTYSTTLTLGEGFSSAEEWTGDLAEIIGWGVALTDTEMRAQAATLAEKYGIGT